MYKVKCVANKYSILTYKVGFSLDFEEDMKIQLRTDLFKEPNVFKRQKQKTNKEKLIL